MIKIKDECCEIIKNIQIADGMFDLTVKSDFIAGTAMCGQFANILVDGKTLRRPISICDAENGVVRFVYQVKGEGTQWLSQRKAGESLVVFGPLGKGFNFKSKPRHIVLIGGGIGTPPMLKTLKTAVENGCIVDVILGFRNKSLVILEDEFKAVANSVTVCTDDGSYGVKGFVTDALKDVLKSQQIDCVMTCGPTPMLKAIAGVCMDNKVSCQVSLEARLSFRALRDISRFASPVLCLMLRLSFGTIQRFPTKLSLNRQSRSAPRCSAMSRASLTAVSLMSLMILQLI